MGLKGLGKEKKLNETKLFSQLLDVSWRPDWLGLKGLGEEKKLNETKLFSISYVTPEIGSKLTLF